jgi:uncharacterized Tic20 family protein
MGYHYSDGSHRQFKIREKQIKERPMSDKQAKETPWFLWPFVALWDLLAFILSLTGRLVAAVLGLVLMIVGLVLTVTLIAAPVGIPLIILGFLLMLRSIF